MDQDKQQSAVSDRVVAWLVPKMVQGGAWLAVVAIGWGYSRLDSMVTDTKLAAAERAAIIRRLDRLGATLGDFTRPGDRFTAADGHRHESAIERVADGLSRHESRLDAIERRMDVLTVRVQAARLGGGIAE